MGALTIKRPLFLEMAIGGLVRGAPGPVVGVVGYDFWRRWGTRAQFPEFTMRLPIPYGLLKVCRVAAGTSSRAHARCKALCRVHRV